MRQLLGGLGLLLIQPPEQVRQEIVAVLSELPIARVRPVLRGKEVYTVKRNLRNADVAKHLV